MSEALGVYGIYMAVVVAGVLSLFAKRYVTFKMKYFYEWTRYSLRNKRKNIVVNSPIAVDLVFSLISVPFWASIFAVDTAFTAISLPLCVVWKDGKNLAEDSEYCPVCFVAVKLGFKGNGCYRIEGND